MARKWWTLVVACAATFMLLLDITIVSVALPDVQRDLDASFGQLQWVTDSYALSLAALLLTAGSLADRLGRRRVFQSGLAVFTVGSLLCGLAMTPVMLIGSRVLQGVGGAMLFATSLALLASSFQGRERGIAFGVWGAVAGVATALGPLLGGALTTGISWRAVFLINLPIGLAAIVITRFTVGESRSLGTSRIDWAGMATFTVGLFSLVYGLTKASETSWTDGTVLLCFAAAAVLLLGFIVIEIRTPDPMFDLSLFRIPTFLGGSVAAIAMNGSLFAMFLYFVLYLQNTLGYSAWDTGLRLLVSSAGTIAAANAAGRFSSSLPTRWLIGPGLVLVGAGLLAMTGLDAGSTWTHLIPGLIVAGVGAGLVNPPLASTAVGVVPPQRSGTASGINQTFRQIGIAVGIALYGSLFSARLESAMARAVRGKPDLEPYTHDLTAAASHGTGRQTIDVLPAPIRVSAARALHEGVAAAMNDLLIVSGGIAIIGGLLAAVLIRPQDFVSQRPSSATAANQDDHPAEVGGAAGRRP